MGHDHSHDHGADAAEHYKEQLSTIAICGGIGAVAVLMWWQGVLTRILVPTLHLPVLLAGATLLFLATVRGVFLWFEVSRPRSAEAHVHDACCSHVEQRETCCQHEHHEGHEHHHHEGREHQISAAAGASAGATPLTVVSAPLDEAPAHDHGHGHDDGHGHNHGWSPWRYAVLLIPIVLFALGMPSAGQDWSAGFVQDRIADQRVADVQFNDNLAGDAAAPVLPLEFNTLKKAAYYPDQRERYQGQVGRLKGQLVRSANGDKTFSLVRIKMTCCAADAIPLNVVIISSKLSPQKLEQFANMEWVEVTGQIDFRERAGHDDFLPVLQLRGDGDLQPATAPPNTNL
jgi:hypothetical protein